MAKNNPKAKVVDFRLLGALFGPGAPDPDLARDSTETRDGFGT